MLVKIEGRYHSITIGITDEITCALPLGPNTITWSNIALDDQPGVRILAQ